MSELITTRMVVQGPEETIQEIIEINKQPVPTSIRTEHPDGSIDYDQWRMQTPEETSALSFWNTVAPKDTDEYYKPSKPQSDGWWDWNPANWSVKQDAFNVSSTESSPYRKEGEIEYEFETYDMPPTRFLIAFSERWPSTVTSIGWINEDTKEGGVWKFDNGDLKVIKEWGEPESHSDFVYMDRLDDCPCAWDFEENWYPDCPRYDDDE